MVHYIEPGHDYITRCRGQETSSHFHGCGFAGTVGPKKTHDLPFLHIKRNIINRQLLVVLLRYVLNLKGHRVIKGARLKFKVQSLKFKVQSFGFGVQKQAWHPKLMQTVTNGKHGLLIAVEKNNVFSNFTPQITFYAIF
jgi:hypothetical protein